MGGPAAFAAPGHEVAQAHVGERAPQQHLVVAAPGAVGVEVARARPRARAGSGPPGCPGAMEPAGEMWSVVTESPRTARTRAPRMSPGGAGSVVEALEEGRLLHVGGVGVPRVRAPPRAPPSPPGLGPLQRRLVLLPEHLGPQAAAGSAATSSAEGQRSLRYTGRPSARVAQRFAGQIDVHRAGQGVGHHQRRRGQIVGPHRADGCGPRSCGCR